jgi:hypothetical protein
MIILLFGVQLATETRRQIAQQETLIDSLGAQVNKATLDQTISTPSLPYLIAQVKKAHFKVFIQFAGYAREDMIVLANSLAREWAVQGANRGGERLISASGLREVRFGSDADKPAATALAQDVENLAIGGGNVALKKIAGIPNGTLELWIGLK